MDVDRLFTAGFVLVVAIRTGERVLVDYFSRSIPGWQPSGPRRANCTAGFGRIRAYQQETTGWTSSSRKRAHRALFLVLCTKHRLVRLS